MMYRFDKLAYRLKNTQRLTRYMCIFESTSAGCI